MRATNETRRGADNPAPRHYTRPVAPHKQGARRHPSDGVGKCTDLYEERFNSVPGQLADEGKRVTYTAIAHRIGVSPCCIKGWADRHATFGAAIDQAREHNNDDVEQALLKRSKGYSVRDRHYPPDTLSMIFWLKNRRPAEWRDRQELAHSGNITVNRVDFRNAESVGFNPDGSKRE